MPGHNHLSALGMPPFLMAAFLADHDKAISAQDANHVMGIADWEPNAHDSATSKILAPAGSGSGDGSNHSSKASFAFTTASSSVSPAEAQPGSSGKKAAQRFVSESCSITRRSFIRMTMPCAGRRSKLGCRSWRAFHAGSEDRRSGPHSPANCFRYFTATVRSFGQGAVMVSGSPVTGWGRVSCSACRATVEMSGRSSRSVRARWGHPLQTHPARASFARGRCRSAPVSPCRTCR